MEILKPVQEAYNVAQRVIDFGISRMSIKAWSEMPRSDQLANITYHEGGLHD